MRAVVLVPAPGRFRQDVNTLMFAVDDDVDGDLGLGVGGDLGLQVVLPVAGGDLQDEAEADRVVRVVLDEVLVDVGIPFWRTSVSPSSSPAAMKGRMSLVRARARGASGDGS
jgi:hypothetical protein